MTDQSSQIVGPNAIVRHILTGETESEGKTNAIKIGVLLAWQKQDGRWKPWQGRPTGSRNHWGQVLPRGPKGK